MPPDLRDRADGLTDDPQTGGLYSPGTTFHHGPPDQAAIHHEPGDDSGYNSEPDFHTPTDQSAAKDYSNPQSATQQALANAEQGNSGMANPMNQRLTGGDMGDAGNPARQSQSYANRAKSLSRADHGIGTADALGADASNQAGANPMNWTPSKGQGKGQGKGKGKLQSKVKRRIIGWVIGGGATLAGGASVALGPGLLINKIESVIEKKFDYAAASMQNHVQKLWACKIKKACASKVSADDAANKGTDEKMGNVSQAAEDSIKANGGEIVRDSSGAPTGIETTAGEARTEITGDNLETLGEKSPGLAGEFAALEPANQPDAVTYGDEAFGNVEREFGIGKNVPLSDTVGEDETGKQIPLDEQVADSTDSKAATDHPNTLGAELAATVNPADHTSTNATGFKPPPAEPTTESGGNDILQQGKTAAKPDVVEDNASMVKRAGGVVEGVNSKLNSGPSAAVQAAVGMVCGASGALRDVSIAVKIIKYSYLIKYAATFMSVASAIRAAGDGQGSGPSPQQISQIAGLLTTVMKDEKGNVKTKSGTDSFGYQMMSGELDPAGSFSTSAVKDDTTPGSPSLFTSSVVMDSNAKDKDNTIFGYIQNALKDTPFNPMSSNMKTSCADANKAIEMAAVGQGAGLLSDLFKGPAGWVTGVVQLGGMTLSAAGGMIGGKFGSMMSQVGNAAAVGASCVSAIGPPSPAYLACAIGVLGIIVGYLIQHEVSSIIKNVQANFLQNPMPVSADAMDSITSGAGASMGAAAGANANAPLPPDQAMAYLNQMNQYNLTQAKIAQATDSPFDVMNNDTFLGSIAGNFAAAMYSNGASPLGFAMSLLGMFGSALGNLVSGTSAMTSAATSSYVSSCQDNTSTANGQIAADPFCNPIYGLPRTTDIQDTMDAIAASGANDPASCSGGFSTTYGLCASATVGSVNVGDFISHCLTRNSDQTFTPMGISNGSMSDGGDCTPDGNDSVNNLLYNYVQYYLANSGINQGSSLGAQADGSAAAAAGGGGGGGGGTTPVTPATGGQTVVYLDPGHAGGTVTPTVAPSGGSKGIVSGDSGGMPGELQAVWNVAQIVKTKLEADGYKVVLSKPTADTASTLWQKGNAAETANNGKPADIAVSIHTSAGLAGYSVAYDAVGNYRQNYPSNTYVQKLQSDANITMNKVTFTNDATAKKSQQYATAIYNGRKAAESDFDGTLSADMSGSFGANRAASSDLQSTGNTAIVMLSAQDVPWIYSEKDVAATGITAAQQQQYAKGLIDGIEKAIDPGTTAPATSGLPVAGDTANATQVITVSAASTSSTTATVEVWNKTGDTWTPQSGLTNISANVGKQGLTKTPSESISATPIGSFTLTQAFGAKSNPGTKLKYTDTAPTGGKRWWWDESPSSSTYNSLVLSATKPGGSQSGSEDLYASTPAYNYAVVMNVNMTASNGSPGAQNPNHGSGFFLHVSENAPTAGCVAIPENDLVAIMKWLDPAKNPRIVINISTGAATK